jgi:hypothetical protein
MSIDPGLDEAVDCLVELYDASRNAGIDAIRAKVRGCAEQYEVRFAGAGGNTMARARKRLADAFINQVPDTPLSPDMSEEIKSPTR